MSALVFEFVGVDRTSVHRRGTVQAISRGEAYRKVAAMGFTPVSIKPAARSLASRLGSGKIKSKDLAHFTYQLGVLVSARIPISEGLLSVAQQEKDGPLKAVVVDLARRIEAGEGIAQAMDNHRAALGEVYVETIRAAEKSGNLSKMLEHLSEMLEKQQEMVRQVRGAMMYPVVVVVVLSLAIVFLVGFVVPKFAKMFASRGQQLPMFTQVLMNLGLSFQNYWWAYLIGVGVLVGALRWLWTNPGGRRLLDRVVHHVPYIRDILIGFTISRFCRIFALSLQSGLGLIDSLELAGKAAGRPMLLDDVQKMIGQVRSGGRLMEVLTACKYLTPFTKRMLTAGEQSAEIPRMCGVVSAHYERETSHLSKNLATVIEPVLIVAIAGVVLVIALAIFLPMWDMVKLVG